MDHTNIIGSDERILITGANGFIGSRVVETLLRYGYKNLCCFTRPTSDVTRLNKFLSEYNNAHSDIVRGNLLSRHDCNDAARGAAVIYHLAAGIEKTYPGSFMNSVVTTRNLLESTKLSGAIKRFVNISSFAVYSNFNLKQGSLFDESCPVEDKFLERNEPYVYAKLRQDEMVIQYCTKHAIPYVILRPGAVYGPGKPQLTARIGIDTFGFFLHLGGSNSIPLTYVDNCAEAIVLAGIRKGVDGEIFNIVDDDLPTSRQFLSLYKRNAKHFSSIYLPYPLFYMFSYFWQKYAQWSNGQLPAVFNTRRCSAYWKKQRYSNKKLKDMLGWNPRVSFQEGSQRFFDSVR